jgi:diadenosine tetraphosphate (Ap4A) HIT family hydrolase
VAEFVLDPRIGASSHAVAGLTLCELRLQDDGRFPWAVLVPRVAGAVELSDLSREQQQMLLDEIALAARWIGALGEAWALPVDKLNIANLGNVTPQLHWHVVGRRSSDPCWPGPVWGQGVAMPLDPVQVGDARRLWSEIAA